MTPNRRLIAQYFDVYRPIIDTYLFLARIVRSFFLDAFVHTYASVCAQPKSTTECYTQFKAANVQNRFRCALEGES